MNVDTISTDIRISSSFSAPRIKTECDEDAETDICSTHSLMERSGINNNNLNSAEEDVNLAKGQMETQSLSPLQLRPHSNSVCTSLLAPDMPKRSHMHRASDSLLISEAYRKQQERRTSQVRSSVIDQELYWKTNEARHRGHLLSTPLASYIFVFISVFITFTIVFGVGVLINSMTYKGKSTRNATLTDLNTTGTNFSFMGYNTSDDKLRNFNSRLF